MTQHPTYSLGIEIWILQLMLNLVLMLHRAKSAYFPVIEIWILQLMFVVEVSSVLQFSYNVFLHPNPYEYLMSFFFQHVSFLFNANN
jgi:hypothetical protein